MNKIAVYIGIAVLGFLLLLAGIYILNRPSTESLSEETSQEPVSTSNSDKFSGTLQDILSMNENQVCNFVSNEQNGTRTEGTVYVASQGSRMSGEFTVQSPDEETFVGNIIRDGQYNYIWTTLEQQGAKIKINPESDSIFGEAAGNVSNSTGLTDTSEVDFDCDNWSVDERKFIPPSNVEFVDLTSSLDQLQELMGGECSACQQLPAGDTRNQCLQALNCTQ